MTGWQWHQLDCMQITCTLLQTRHVFKESAEQRFPLSVFLAQSLPYFRQPLLSLGSPFNRRCHRWRSREDGSGSCKQRDIIRWNHVIHALLQITYVDCWRIWIINIKSNATTRNAHVLYQLKHTGRSLQYGDHHGNCSAVACMLAYCAFNTTSAAISL